MNEMKFTATMRDIFAAFGKSIPTQPVLDAIFRRIGEFPDSFLPYLQSRLEDMEKLPANLGLFIKSELWPEFLAKNPNLVTRRPEYLCQKCGGTGFLHAYRIEEGLYFGSEEAFECVCRNRANGWTRENIMATGKYSFADPLMPENPTNYRQNRMLTAALAADDSVRPRHQEYMERYVEADF